MDLEVAGVEKQRKTQTSWFGWAWGSIARRSWRQDHGGDFGSASWLGQLFDFILCVPVCGRRAVKLIGLAGARAFVMP